jgi:hypothetical protein
MQSRFRRRYLSAIALGAIVFASVPSISPAQGTQTESFRVLIDGAAAGTATSVTNLPADPVVVRQDSNPSLPPKQVISGGQGSVVLTTADPALVAAIQAWMKADNTGFKDTVQHKTVEIDRLLGNGSATRYRLSDAWPSKVEGPSGSTMITLVFQRLEIIS